MHKNTQTPASLMSTLQCQSLRLKGHVYLVALSSEFADCKCLASLSPSKHAGETTVAENLAKKHERPSL